MKRRRFEELHREAVRWPTAYFHYVGIDADGEGTAAQEGEVSHTVMADVKLNLFCILVSKRIQAIRARFIWMPFYAFGQATGAESVLAVPLVLYILARARTVVELVSRYPDQVVSWPGAMGHFY